MYRAYNPNAKSGSHNYTTSKSEQNYLVKVGWRNENIAWYGSKKEKPIVSKVNKSELQALYNKVKGTSKGNYTEATWKIFQNALNNAKSILDSAKVDQVKVNDAKETLQSTFNGLKKEPEIKKYTIKVTYLDSTQQELKPATETQVVQDSSYTATAPTIEGYVLQGEATQTISRVQSDATITFQYVPETKKYTVKMIYLDSGQNELKPATEVQVEQGKYYSAKAQTIDGYVVKASKTQFIRVQSDVTITFQYVLDASDIFEATISGGKATITGFKTGQDSTTPVIPEYVVRKEIAYPVTSIKSWALGNKNLVSVKIPDTVTEIKSFAFANNNLTEITIPNSIASISQGAFSGNKLESVTMSDSIQSIEADAFSHNDLTTIVIPSNVKAIGERAFSENKLKNVVIPEGIESIAIASFAQNKLESVDFPTSLVSIKERAFYSNKLSTVNIPDQVNVIGEDAFSNNELTSINLPSNLQTIEKGSFSDNKLTSVTIPQNVTSVGSWAFGNNQLSDASIPLSVMTIDYNAFWNNKLTKVTISSKCQLGQNAFDSTVIVARE